MFGYNAGSVLAEMIDKGVQVFYYEREYEAMNTTEMNTKEEMDRLACLVKEVCCA